MSNKSKGTWKRTEGGSTHCGKK